MRISRQNIGAFWKETLPDYCLHVLHYWWVIGFCMLIAIVGAIANISEFDVPNWIWWASGLLGFHAAQFLAWNDMRKERNELRRYDVTQEALHQIAEYKSQAISYQNEKMKGDEELGAWWERYSSLRKNIIAFIGEKFGAAEALLFERIGTFELVVLPGDPEDIDYRRLQRRSMIIRDHRWLDELAKDFGRARYRAPPENRVETVA